MKDDFDDLDEFIPAELREIAREKKQCADVGSAAADVSPPAFSDEALARRFAEIHANDLRYVAAWGKCFSWTGTHWRVDDTLRAFDLVRDVSRQAAAS